MGLPHCVIQVTQGKVAPSRIPSFNGKSFGALMSFDLSATHETRSIRAAQLHGRLAAACTEIFVSLALIVSICAVVLMPGTNAASAAARNLVMVDDGISA